jgi:esterase/lipase superfamily enzyme
MAPTKGIRNYQAKKKRFMKKLILLLIACIFSSCANHKFSNYNKRNEALTNIWQEFFNEDFSDTKSMDILVVTNRKTVDTNFGCNNNSFGIGGKEVLNFGICKINVPKNHSTGEIIFTDNNRQSSNDYFKILEAKSMKEANLIADLKKSKTPLIFVHGFNVSFGEAVLRAAQIGYDLKYQGPVILFSWPAGAEDSFFGGINLSKTYQNNLASARNSVSSLKNFLISLQKNDIKINLIVHSMGHQIVLPALKQLGDLHPYEPLINELVLNAPDFNSEDFKSLVKDIKKVSKRITLYCSYNDKAMFASKTFNNNERLGACTFLTDLDSINVSLVADNTLELGHGYYSSRAILTDVFQTLLGIDASKRLFIKKSEPNSTEKYFLRQ